MKEIQLKMLSINNSNFKDNINCYYKKISQIDDTTAICQHNINKLLHYYSYLNYGVDKDEINTKLLIMGQNLDVESYARMKGLKFLEQQVRKINYNKMKNITLTELAEIVNGTSETIYEQIVTDRLSIVWTHIPQKIRSLLDIKIETTGVGNSFIITVGNKSKDIGQATAKEIQTMIKDAKGREKIDFMRKHGFEVTEMEYTKSMQKMYKIVKNPTIRALELKIWHNDIFSKSRMKKFNMTDEDKCPRCNQTEDVPHQLYNCKQARYMWELYNTIMKEDLNEDCVINEYKEIILTRPQDTPQSELLKMIIVKLNIQIERPFFNRLTILKEMIKYIDIESGSKTKSTKRWQQLRNILLSLLTNIQNTIVLPATDET
jgi:hypothetical protein